MAGLYLSEFIREAQYRSSVTVVWQDSPVAAGQAGRQPRQPGALRGRIVMKPDFDVLPPDMLAAMEGDDG